MHILGIETSCDETGVGLVSSEQGIIGQALFSQAELHQAYGGVVPELASRDHACRLTPLVRQALSGTRLEDIDAVAYTAGPGLAGALLTGAVFAHGIAEALRIPALAIHHMEAHLLTLQLSTLPPEPPFVVLLVSGGHTQLVLVKKPGAYVMLGESLDDAAGEAFDKTARLLGLSYPGGPAIERIAQRGCRGRFQLPRPMLDKGLDFSFSGLKTSVLRTVQSNPSDIQTKADIALAFEEAIVETLATKCHYAIEHTGVRRLAAAGGVSANNALRKALQRLPAEVFFPRHDLCTDNGVMIAYAGLFRYSCEGADYPQIYPRWQLPGVSYD